MLVAELEPHIHQLTVVCLAVMPNRRNELPVHSSAGAGATLEQVKLKHPWWPLAAWKTVADMSLDECQQVVEAVTKNCSAHRTAIMSELDNLPCPALDRVMVDIVMTCMCE